VKVLLLGAGSIGRRHLKNLLHLGVRDIAVYDPDPGARQWVSQEYSLVTLDAYEPALDWGADAALVCTPNHLHLSQARDLLNQGMHLFIEKPIAESWEGVPEFVHDVERSGKVVQVGFNMRFHPAVRRIQEALQGGQIGVPWVLRNRYGHYLPQWRPGQDYRHTYSAHADQGGGILMDSIHEVDSMVWWGGEVQEVTALLAHTSHLEIDVEDYATVLLRFASGAAGEVRLDYLRYDKLRDAEVIGSEGMILWESRGKAPEHVLVQRFDPISRSYTTLCEVPEYDVNETYVDELRHFFGCIQAGENPLVTAAEAAKSVAVVLEAKGGLRPALADRSVVR